MAKLRTSQKLPPCCPRESQGGTVSDETRQYVGAPKLHSIAAACGATCRAFVTNGSTCSGGHCLHFPLPFGSKATFDGTANASMTNHLRFKSWPNPQLPQNPWRFQLWRFTLWPLQNMARIVGRSAVSRRGKFRDCCTPTVVGARGGRGGLARLAHGGGRGGGWYEAMVLVCLPLAAPIICIPKPGGGGAAWRAEGSKYHNTTPAKATPRPRNPATPTTGLRERGNDTSRNTSRSGRQKAATHRSTRREERVAVQGPIKK